MGRLSHEQWPTVLRSLGVCKTFLILVGGVTLQLPIMLPLASSTAGPFGRSSSGSGGGSPRTRTRLDLGWRFHLGNPANSGSASLAHCNSSTFPVNLSHVQCLGLTQQRGPQTADECRAAGCSSRAAIWQWGGGCWTGQAPYNCTPGPSPGGIVGAGRHGAPLPAENASCAPGLPCEPSYDDSSWRTVTVPHDFVIEVRSSF